jgi:hypothetical protein
MVDSVAKTFIYDAIILRFGRVVKKTNPSTMNPV